MTGNFKIEKIHISLRDGGKQRIGSLQKEEKKAEMNLLMLLFVLIVIKGIHMVLF